MDEAIFIYSLLNKTIANKIFLSKSNTWDLMHFWISHFAKRLPSGHLIIIIIWTWNGTVESHIWHGKCTIVLYDLNITSLGLFDAKRLRYILFTNHNPILGRKKSPRRGIEPRSPAWQAGILTTILTRNAMYSLKLILIYIWILCCRKYFF